MNKNFVADFTVEKGKSFVKLTSYVAKWGKDNGVGQRELGLSLIAMAKFFMVDAPDLDFIIDGTKGALERCTEETIERLKGETLEIFAKGTGDSN